MRSPFRYIVMIIAVEMVAGDYQEDFCRKRIPNVDDSSSIGQKPVFYDNFYVFYEIKDLKNQSVSYQEEYFSQAAGLIYATSKTQASQQQSWIDAQTDEITVGPLGQKICNSSDLKGTPIAQLLGVTVDSEGNVSLSSPQDVLGWNRKEQKLIKNMGKSKARGIDTLVWHICSYNEETDITSYGEWHIVDPDYITLPVVQKDKIPKPVLPILINAEGVNSQHTSDYSYSIDFTFFNNVQPNDEIFQIPTTKLCSTKLSAQVPLPKAPSYFKFKGEQITINNPTSQTPEPPDLVFTIEEYTQLSQIFIQDFISTPDDPSSGNDKSFLRNINDYNTGLSFQMDLTTGGCSVTVIPPTDVDSIPVAGGNVQMRTSQQFFDLDSDKYQYMGTHTKRGILCDTWSAYLHDGQSDQAQNSLYTWYFSNVQWMQNNGFSNLSPFPVTLEVQRDEAFIQFNIYEFDTQDQMKTPDISLCFDPTSTLNVEFYISASYVQIVTPDVQGFLNAVYATIVQLTSLKSILRISELDVQPTSSTEIVVRFKLLDIASVKIHGDVSKPEYDAPNSQIFNDLVQKVNAGSFSIDIATSSDVGQGKRTVVARPNSVEQFVDGKNMIGSQSSGYSPGALAGIGVGMLALGIIMGFIINSVVKRVRAGGIGNDINLKKLDEETQS